MAFGYTSIFIYNLHYYESYPTDVSTESFAPVLEVKAPNCTKGCGVGSEAGPQEQWPWFALRRYGFEWIPSNRATRRKQIYPLRISDHTDLPININ